MRYLFFDCEFATCYNGVPKICEFGYIITDENFVVIEQDNLMINPKIQRRHWDYYAVKKILTHSIKEYENAPSFEYYYHLIEALITKADYVFGHAIDLDVTAINGDCKRYFLKPINFTIYDNKRFFMARNQLKNDPGVKTILDSFQIEIKGNEHDAMDDAYNTMLGLKAMLQNYEMTLTEMIAAYPSAAVENTRYDIDAILAESRRKLAIKRAKEKRMLQQQ